MRVTLPEADESPEATAVLTAWNVAHRGTRLGGVWRGPDDAVLSPPWLSVRSISADFVTGNVAAAGCLAYGVWGIEMDAPSFLMVDGVYVGSLRSGTMLPLDLGISASSVDLDPKTGEIAVLHHLANSTYGVSTVDAFGVRRLLTVLEEITGNEPLRYSPDGHWLLVPRTGESYLIEVESGRHLRLGVGNTTWLQSAESDLFTIDHDGETPTPRLFSLRSNSYVGDYPAIKLDVPLLESYPYLWHPVVSHNGDEVLVRTPAGVTVEYQHEHGVGQHVARFESATGRGTLVVPVFANPEGTLERDAADTYWTERGEAAWSLTLHPDLEAELSEPVTNVEDPDWLLPERWADEAEIVLVSMLNRAIELLREGSSVSHLMPEIVASLRPIANSPVWIRQSDWLTNLRDITMSMGSSGEMDADLSMPWLLFALAIREIEQGDSDEISAITFRR